MQDRYVGDVGDYGKYHLLKSLCTGNGCGPDLSLGVVWYLVPNEGNNGDGKHIRYLDLEKAPSNLDRFRKGDPALYDALREIVTNGTRNVLRIQLSKVLPAKTVFYDRPLSFKEIPNNSPVARDKRIALRDTWAQDALMETASCDFIFVDPDNGLEVPSVVRHHKKGPKYAYYKELVPFLQRKQSLVIYHHLGRTGSVKEQVSERLSQIKDKLETVDGVYALLYRRGTLRAFFVVPAAQHRDILLKRGRHLSEEVPWREHFCFYI